MSKSASNETKFQFDDINVETAEIDILTIENKFKCQTSDFAD